MCVSGDRWTCPTCGRTIVVWRPGSDAITRLELAARQWEHQQAHTLAEMVRAELPS